MRTPRVFRTGRRFLVTIIGHGCWSGRRRGAGGRRSNLDDSPEQLAVTFLSFEVPRWPVENGCYSCHNNGDAARALYTAVGMAMPVELQALRDTTDWVQRAG